MIKIVDIDARQITDWDSFHDVFCQIFGFPGFYGRNMDAWIDCMSYIDDKDSGMINFCVETGDTVVINLSHSDVFRHECIDIYQELSECIGFVNSRNITKTNGPIIAIALS